MTDKIALPQHGESAMQRKAIRCDTAQDVHSGVTTPCGKPTLAGPCRRPAGHQRGCRN
jgi:hypothetical protein